jgi:uncharacterized membrane protein SirB2
MNKTFFIILVVAVYFFFNIWAFNHIDPWVSIGFFIVGIYIAAKQIFKTNKKEEK